MERPGPYRMMASADRRSHPVQPTAPGNTIFREVFALNSAPKALTLWPGCGGCHGAGLSRSCPDMGVGAVGSPSRHSPSNLSAAIFPLTLWIPKAKLTLLQWEAWTSAHLDIVS